MSDTTSFHAYPNRGEEGRVGMDDMPAKLDASELKMSQKELQIVKRIYSVMVVHETLREYVSKIQISIENAVIILRGSVPSDDLRAALIPAVRRAGVLGQVNNCVNVA